VLEGSLVDLSTFPEDHFDAVVCLGGPLSHVLCEERRREAVAELIRVTRPGGMLFVSVMGRLSVLVVELTLFPQEIGMFHFDELRDTGDYHGGYGFTACHFFLPEELREAFAGQGVEVLQMVGLEGISSHHRRELNRLARDPERWPGWLETHFRTCTHPAVVGMSEHMLIVCRKEEGRE